MNLEQNWHNTACSPRNRGKNIQHPENPKEPIFKAPRNDTLAETLRRPPLPSPLLPRRRGGRPLRFVVTMNAQQRKAVLFSMWRKFVLDPAMLTMNISCSYVPFVY